MRLQFDVPDDLLDPALAPHALAVGALCNAWAHLEECVRWLFLNVANLECGPRTSIAIVNTLQPRDMIRAVKFALVESLRPQEIKTMGCEALDYIDSELRPWRNRYVHDRWHHFIEDGDIARWNDTPSIKRPGSRQPPELTPFTINYEDVRLVYELAQDVKMYAHFLNQIGAAYTGGDEEFINMIVNQPPQPPHRRTKS